MTQYTVTLRGETVEVREFKLDPEHVKTVVDGMYGVVNEGGTGARAKVQGIEICGKTGTAQLASAEALKALKGDDALKDNAWFVGFAPRENPEIVVAALVEGGLHGATAAAPIARYRTPFSAKGTNATMMTALKMTADRMALRGLASPITFNAFSAG